MEPAADLVYAALRRAFSSVARDAHFRLGFGNSTSLQCGFRLGFNSTVARDAHFRFRFWQLYDFAMWVSLRFLY